MPQCAHHVDSKKMEDCSEIKQIAPKCTKTCSGNEEITYTKDKHFGKSSYSVDSEDDLMQEL